MVGCNVESEIGASTQASKTALRSSDFQGQLHIAPRCVPCQGCCGLGEKIIDLSGPGQVTGRVRSGCNAVTIQSRMRETG